MSAHENVRKCHDLYQSYCSVSNELRRLDALLVYYQTQGIGIGRLRESVEKASSEAAELGAKALLALEKALERRDNCNEADMPEATDPS